MGPDPHARFSDVAWKINFGRGVRPDLTRILVHFLDLDLSEAFRFHLYKESEGSDEKVEISDWIFFRKRNVNLFWLWN